MTALLLFVMSAVAFAPCAGQVVVGDREIVAVPVTEIRMRSCRSVVTVTDASQFNIGDRVLIHQAKGVRIQPGLLDSGNVIQLGSCGNFEFGSVYDINGNNITLESTLAREYDIGSRVQLVPVVSADHVIVNGRLTARKWNGSCGGVIVIEARDTVVLYSSISVSAMGFDGGDLSAAFPSCRLSPDFNATFPSNLYAEKGEGVVVEFDTQRSGRGRLANGGGGGGNHNAGGGGGGNGGYGGVGGAVIGTCGVQESGGIGGSPIINQPSDVRLFLGGGGGGGHDNEREGTRGGSGGGIIFIAAPVLVCNSDGLSLTSAGSDVGIAGHDGSGGGGAGGTVLLACNEVLGQLNIDLTGGDGGSVGNNVIAPHGPGGGGSGGQALFTLPNQPTAVQVVSPGGSNGVNRKYPSGVQQHWYSEPGNAGTTYTDCVLPVETIREPFVLESLSSKILGSSMVGSTFIVDLLFVNKGPSEVFVDSVASRQGRLSLITSNPSLTVLMAPEDTLLVTCRVTVDQVGEQEEALILYCQTPVGCVTDTVFDYTWLGFEVQDSCYVSATLTGGIVETGNRIKVSALLERIERVQIGQPFECVISFTRKDLFVERASKGFITRQQMIGDQTYVSIAGEYDGTDTLFSIEAVGLLSPSETTSLRFAEFLITNDNAICDNVVTGSTIELGTVCASRQIRTILLSGANANVFTAQGCLIVELVPVESDIEVDIPAILHVSDLTGTHVDHRILALGRTSVDLPRGTYVVRIQTSPGWWYSRVVFVE